MTLYNWKYTYRLIFSILRQKNPYKSYTLVLYSGDGRQKLLRQEAAKEKEKRQNSITFKLINNSANRESKLQQKIQHLHYFFSFVVHRVRLVTCLFFVVGRRVLSRVEGVNIPNTPVHPSIHLKWINISFSHTPWTDTLPLWQTAWFFLFVWGFFGQEMTTSSVHSLWILFLRKSSVWNYKMHW